jgi:hypothetical protein
MKRTAVRLNPVLRKRGRPTKRKIIRFTTWGKGGTLPDVNLDSNAALLARMDGLDDPDGRRNHDANDRPVE